jgi:hypothetical protein
MLNKEFSKLCTPAKLYFAIAVISSVVALLNGVHLMGPVVNLVFAFIWTYVLGWMCKNGYSSIAWFLVLLPYIMMALVMLNLFSEVGGIRQLMRMIKLQGAYGQEPMKTLM